MLKKGRIADVLLILPLGNYTPVKEKGEAIKSFPLS
jgi:hypothetical protein